MHLYLLFHNTDVKFFYFYQIKCVLCTKTKKIICWGLGKMEETCVLLLRHYSFIWTLKRVKFKCEPALCVTLIWWCVTQCACVQPANGSLEQEEEEGKLGLPRRLELAIFTRLSSPFTRHFRLTLYYVFTGVLLLCLTLPITLFCNCRDAKPSSQPPSLTLCSKKLCRELTSALGCC